MAINKSDQPTKRALNALETKRNIFNKSIELFREYGFDTVTIGDITSELNLSKGTFYVHFPSKESILIEQFRQIDEHYSEIYEAFPKDISAYDATLSLMQGMCDYCSKVVGLPLMQVVYANQACSKRASSILDADDRLINQLLDEIYDNGVSRGELKSILNGKKYSDFIMRQARSLIFDWCLRDGDFDLIKEGDTFFRLILTLFKP